jgi:8-oxo-dGTP pyrophosphatase MutT (NUDIX family)
MDLVELEGFLAERLSQPLPGAEAQHRFAPTPLHEGWRADDRPDGARHAAALLLIYPGPLGLTVPLTVRHTDLPHHPGQISFPGGRVGADETAEQAAIRETHEEIGVRPDRVRILGPLSTLWIVVSNHLLEPFVGVTTARPDFELAPREVEALVEVPLSDIRDMRRVKSAMRVRDGRDVTYPFFDLGGHQVWGATAMVLGEFAALFEEASGIGPQASGTDDSL